jgi:hypothetical protein
METSSKSKRYLGSFLNVALGAGAVISGAYIFSRLKDKRDVETRLERMEQILEKITSGEEPGNS